MIKLNQLLARAALFAAFLPICQSSANPFPWNKEEISQVRCLMAKPGMVMLILEFDRPLENSVFNNRSYMLVKWILKNDTEVEINEILHDKKGILPGIGKSFNKFTLADLLPGWPDENLALLSRSIQKRSKEKKAILDSHFALANSDKSGTTLIFMPFMPLMTMEDFIDRYGASKALSDKVQEDLGHAFTFMRTHGIIHGDLALRNIGVILKEEGLFQNHVDALNQISQVILFDFGSRSAGFLKYNQGMPAKETLEYVVGLVTKNIKVSARPKPARLERRKKTTEPDVQSDFVPSSPLITPLQRFRHREQEFGSAHKRAKRGIEFNEEENIDSNIDDN